MIQIGAQVLCLVVPVVAIGLFACAPGESAAPILVFEPYEFEAGDGTVVDAERGTMMVSENRGDPDAREIELGLVRFRSTSDNPGPPIIYLAGGPGGSGVGTARGRRFPLFMAMREFGDVIAFDQRGTGWSNAIPRCATEYRSPEGEPVNLRNWVSVLNQAADECAAFWGEQGVDLSGYNTGESARDLDDLRRGLRVEQVSLWGISYGSHLAFAALKQMGESIDRVVLAAAEGLGHTVKLPARTDTYFGRLQDVIDADPIAAAAYPDLAELMRNVHAKLQGSPIELTFTSDTGEPVVVLLGKVEMQALASALIADPASAAELPAVYAAADGGSVTDDRMARFLYQQFGGPFSFGGMSEAMDIMSGISARRLAAVQHQAESSLLGNMLNFPMPHLIGAFGLDPLSDDFRQEVRTDVPTLFLTGTLDGRTYPEAAQEIISGFSNATQVIVENGGHNVYMQDPVISEIVLAFMRGADVPGKVTLPPPIFVRDRDQ